MKEYAMKKLFTITTYYQNFRNTFKDSEMAGGLRVSGMQERGLEFKSQQTHKSQGWPHVPVNLSATGQTLPDPRSLWIS